MSDKIVDGYTTPVEPGTYFVRWGTMGANDVPDKVVVRARPDMEMRLDSYATDGKWLGFIQCPQDKDDTLSDWLRLLRDDENFKPGSNGYYVDFANDPHGERGTGGVDPETGGSNGQADIKFIKWVAP